MEIPLKYFRRGRPWTIAVIFGGAGRRAAGPVPKQRGIRKREDHGIYDSAIESVSNGE